MNTQLWYRLAADAVLLAHVLFVVFVVAGLAMVLLGGLRDWPWVRNRPFRTLHLAAILIVVLQSWLGAICPLTALELALRSRAGDATYNGSFVAHWLERLLYLDAPAWAFAIVYTIFGGLVAASWFLVPPQPRQRRR